ncbi:MAG: HD domain-containing protein [Telluria sp.]
MSAATCAAWRDRIIAIATRAADDDGAHDLPHLHRVWSNALVLLQEHPQADPLVVMAACYLHDLVNLPKNDPRRHLASRASAEQARAELAAIGFPQPQLDAVPHAIEAHSFSAAIPARTLEARIVQDADRLDALGPVGLARMFYVAGRLNLALAHTTDPLAQDRGPDDRQYALDHIMVKLAALPEGMQTAAGRRLAEERLQTLLAFRAEFAAQWLADR